MVNSGHIELICSRMRSGSDLQNIDPDVIFFAYLSVSSNLAAKSIFDLTAPFEISPIYFANAAASISTKRIGRQFCVIALI